MYNGGSNSIEKYCNTLRFCNTYCNTKVLQYFSIVLQYYTIGATPGGVEVSETNSNELLRLNYYKLSFLRMKM